MLRAIFFERSEVLVSSTLKCAERVSTCSYSDVGDSGAAAFAEALCNLPNLSTLMMW
jgi:hypothetical protein